MIRRICGVLALITLAVPFALAQKSDDFYTEAHILSPVKVWVPAPRDGVNPPLLVGLHGRGDTAGNMAAFWGALKEPKPILVLPEAPYPLLRYGVEPSLGWSWDFPSQDRDLWKIADPNVVKYILDVVHEVQKKHPSRGVYILGHSQGVSYGYMAMAQQRELIKGMIAVAGILPPPDMLSDEDLKKAAGRTKVLIAHGTEDKQIAIKISQDAKTRLEGLGFSVIFKEFAAGHQVPKDVLLDAQDWINACEKVK